MLKILVVDDQPQRFDFFKTEVIGKFALEKDIHLTIDSKAALSRLGETVYDIMIVDMAIPATSWDKDTVASGGVKLLQHLTEDDTLYHPKYIIGITGSTDEDADVTNYFANSTWTLLKTGKSGSDWSDRLIKLIEHAANIGKHEAEIKYLVDVCIVTALPDPEQSAVLQLPIIWEDNPQYVDSNTPVRRGVLTISDRGQLSIISACSMRMGSTESALLTLKLINKFRPRLVTMSGICAGMEKKTNYGDAILASPVWDWTASKWERDANGQEVILPAPHYIECAREVTSRFRTLQQDATFFSQMRTEWPATKPSTVLAAHIGPCASGPIVVADGTTLQKIKATQHRDVLGLEMEAYGLYCAAAVAGVPRPMAFSIKAVCDFADPRKNDEMQKYAAYTSARTLYEFLRRHGRELCSVM
ncbi:hypothetical protein GTP81_17205 [Rugamonas sp. FT107W]|uniref:Nucleoside phosphorylase domain-containing protein n=1 Tax=Duganella vulcania TaxID=2692166 RepID=A0A845HIC1_9BURK|nr:hypothetical protein [Duganella vulcania]MYN18491.1 hypothetical protein [Duganella vulcania]